ncbi:MAG: peptidylprolyl isomerase [Desulfuromonadaceae bacterium]
MRIIMKKFATFLSSIAVLGIQTVIAFGAGPGATEPQAASARAEVTSQTLSTDVLARVNGTAITRAEVDRAIRIFLAQNRVSHDLSPEALKQAEEAALEQLIATRLLYQTGLKLELKDLDKQIVARINLEKTKFATPVAYDAVLKTNNFTEQDTQEIVRNDIVVTNLVDKEIISKIDVSEADVKKYYSQNQEKFTKPENVRLSHILIGVAPQATAEEKQTAREKAVSIRNKILAGADFATLAKAESSCISKEHGGDLGAFEKEEMIPEFEKAAELLKNGEISQVVETQDGYHILKLVEKNSAAVVAFDETKVKIESFLKQIKTQQAIKDYVANLRKMAKIEMTVPRSSEYSTH